MGILFHIDLILLEKGLDQSEQKIGGLEKLKKSRIITPRFHTHGAPTGIRTPVLALKGLRPSPLDDGGMFFASPLFISQLDPFVKQMTL
jgi:hypothetical protein